MTNYEAAEQAARQCWLDASRVLKGEHHEDVLSLALRKSENAGPNAGSVPFRNIVRLCIRKIHLMSLVVSDHCEAWGEEIDEVPLDVLQDGARDIIVDWLEDEQQTFIDASKVACEAWYENRYENR